MSERTEHEERVTEELPVERPEFEPSTLVRHEETLVVDAEPYEAGRVRARKHVETQHVDEVFPRDVEYAEVERVEAPAGDSGKIETLPDGSVSVPILEEELVVTKRTVVRERVVIRKRTVTEQHRVEADLLRERLDVDADPGVEVGENDDR